MILSIKSIQNIFTIISIKARIFEKVWEFLV